MPIAYYDGSCPLCAREIAIYRTLDKKGVIRWHDLSTAEFESQLQGMTRREALARFHVRRADGTMVAGALAFVEIWRAIPILRSIAGIARTRPMLFLLEWAYGHFLRVRPRLSGRR